MPGEDPCPPVCSVLWPGLRDPTGTTAELVNSKASPGVPNLFASTIFRLPIMNRTERTQLNLTAKNEQAAAVTMNDPAIEVIGTQ